MNSSPRSVAEREIAFLVLCDCACKQVRVRIIFIHKQSTRTKNIYIYIYTKNNLKHWMQTITSKKKAYITLRDTPGATVHLSLPNSNGAKSAKDLINLRPDWGCTVALRIWLSLLLWNCWIWANFHVPLLATRCSLCLRQFGFWIELGRDFDDGS